MRLLSADVVVYFEISILPLLIDQRTGQQEWYKIMIHLFIKFKIFIIYKVQNKTMKKYKQYARGYSDWVTFLLKQKWKIGSLQ